MTSELFSRQALLLGDDIMERIAQRRVIIFGVGGVGGWCAESLVRSGIRHLTLVDPDVVNATNVNRQVVATSSSMGRPKVEVMRERLLDINPEADILAMQKTYSKETMHEFPLEDYDYVIDAIDSLKDKIQLAVHATSIVPLSTQRGVRGESVFFSSMGAALRTDPTKVKVTEFWKVRNDTLGAMMRKRMRQRGLMPGHKYLCVYSDELPQPRRGDVNGTVCQVVGVFGFTLASLVINDIIMHSEL